MKMHTWEKIDAAGTALALKYSFGPGTVNTLVVKLDDGSLLAISPAAGLDGAVLDELSQHGEVKALLAPNGCHHLGQKAWRARWPNAISYAPDASIARLGQKCPDVPFESMSKLQALLGEKVQLIVPPDMKTPDLLARVQTAEGNVWFLGDLVSNTSKDDLAFPLNIVLGIVGAGPGLRFNKMPAMIYLKDKVAWRAWVRAQLLAAPPAVVVPAHGELVREDTAPKLQQILA